VPKNAEPPKKGEFCSALKAISLRPKLQKVKSRVKGGFGAPKLIFSYDLILRRKNGADRET
tara:strand:+ start:1269 stop:1451 length:183 start_codon:yes stop_codon:yes gene_type:complete